MQLTVFVSPNLVNALRQLASRDCRTIHQEARWLLGRAIEEATSEQARAHTTAVQDQERDYAPVS
jgi:predicted transcriptional regulator